MKLWNVWMNFADRYYTPELWKIKIKEQEDIANQANRALRETNKYYDKLLNKIKKSKNIEEVKKIIDKEKLK